ncbi:RNase P subunit RPR2 [Bradyrhizobium sp. RT6a]
MTRSEKPKRWTEAEVQLLFKLAREGARRGEIAKALERYVSSVERVARDMGLQIRK